MYRHLLVPIDNTDRSIEVVGNAVGLAHAVGARITFFHAVTDDGGSVRGGDHAARITSPDDPAHASLGKARELLAKAEAAAHAFGVPCDSKHVYSDQPAVAIVDAARDIGCDLVFMAGHGRHRRAPQSTPVRDTVGAVLDAGFSVLVSRVDDAAPLAHAVSIIRDKHRSLAAVLHAWMQTLAAARKAGAAADPQLMRDIVRYIEIFQLELHDSKEEDHLYERLRKRTSLMNPELDELQRQRRRDRQRMAELAGRVETLAAASGEVAVSATRELDDAVRSYAAFVWEHLGRKESVILPAAQRHLTEADWSAIDAAFAKSRDPRFGGEAAKEARQLFSLIV